jgi:hypothetical protein
VSSDVLSLGYQEFLVESSFGRGLVRRVEGGGLGGGDLLFLNT